jgi:hypothetical protein
MNPFVVVHNGITYTYKPGETVEVPDGVALEIEKIAHWDDKFRAPVTPPIGIDAVLAEAKEYTDSQRLAYEETKVTKLKGFVVPAGQGSYDGEEMVIDAPFAIENGVLYIVTINGKSFETYGGEDSRGTYIKIVENETPVFEAYFISPRFYVRSLDPAGQDNNANRYVTIEARETIVHAIDGKFLPVGGVGYEETVPKLADFVMPAGKGGSSSAYINAPFLFTEGDNWKKTYSITVNGKTYALTGKKNSETFEIGNYDRTVEPHLYIEEFPNYGLWNIYVYDPNGLTDIVDRHVVITEKPAIHTIDPKYLPKGGVGLPVLEMSTVINLDASDPIQFTVEESSVFIEMAQAKSPFVVKFNFKKGAGWEFHTSMIVNYLNNFQGNSEDAFFGHIGRDGAFVDFHFTKLYSNVWTVYLDKGGAFA